VTRKVGEPRLIPHGATFIQPISLVVMQNGGHRIAGIAALQVEPKKCANPPAPLLEVLAAALLAPDGASTVLRQL
jgi:hypothetical protein